ncbi:MAG: ribbon-helix-helix protein, CopG family [Acidimicrobiia bacterium]|jgi:Arc/MetJ-type ribon-helix-helix transcriptional regulator|nr:ribbon-helix-helix protein, CopG family [Acidimicrobiia bacterium]MBP8181197.1 ribbon-helix-helix protein, CopG family [Acidimicrobiia bacterium]
MTTPIPTRFSEEEVGLIDALVAEGVGDSRSAVIRRAVHHFSDAVRREQLAAEIVQSYSDRPQTADDDQLAMANAVALTEAESW